MLARADDVLWASLKADDGQDRITRDPGSGQGLLSGPGS